MKTQTSRRLIRNTLPARGSDFEAVRKDLGPELPAPRACTGSQTDPFTVKDRTLDQVVDRLLKELSW